MVWVHAGDQDWIGHLPADGLIRFSWPALTSSISITVVESEHRQTVSTANRSTHTVPAGISEVRIDPGIQAAVVTDTIEFDCDAGLEMIIDGTRVPLSVSARRDDVLGGVPVPAVPCTDTTVHFTAGEHRVRLAATNWAQPVAVTLRDGEITSEQIPLGDATVERWDATHRSVRVAAGQSAVLVVHENFNDGWQAVLGGTRLDPVRIDGWQQGFVIPEDAGGVVEITYEPQRAMVAGLTVGAVGPPALLGLALIGSRRPVPLPVGERRVGAPVGVILVAVTVALLTGVAGLIAVSALLAIALPLLGRAARTVAPIVGAALLVTAGAMVASAGTATEMIAEARSPTVQLLCVVAVTMALLSVAHRHEPEP